MPAFSLVSRAGAVLMLAAALQALPARAGTLYADLGERPGLTRIVDGMLDRALLDARIKDKFEDANIERLHGLLMLHFCVVTGGPCRYPGRDMKTAHADLGLTPRHFNVIVEKLQDSMDAEGVPFWTQNRLLALLAPMHRDIVSTPADGRPRTAP